ncbi:hypothetical protein [Cetobacterium sp. 2G large]|uniref:hypothetical protein n=1 Tax=Cetobacterium sp. 2G large TaxID=2759680 RepID=UPI00163CDF07|nr:hypothetical protein [Cetobacterium sp. 2G large]MBC2853448.1 hypothetical protein [Cetobacterium sp. 2G large]
MDINEAMEKLFNEKILNIEEIEEIRSGKLKTILFAKYNTEFSLKEISGFLRNRIEFIEISTNLFVIKNKLKNILQDIEKQNYKCFLENRYLVLLKDDDLEAIDKKINKKTYEEILRYGLDNFYVKEEWVKELDLRESEFYDRDEVIQDLYAKGIRIK